MENKEQQEKRISLDGSLFDKVIEDISSNWGEILFIKITDSFVIEVKTTISKGSYGHGYYNFDGTAPLTGHLKASDIAKIDFVDKFFRGTFTKSVEFNKEDGENIFKVFVTRDENRDLKENQVKAFDALAEKLNS